MSKKQIVLDAFHNKEVERTPVGFWFHFVSGKDLNLGVEREDVIEKNLEGHKKFYKEFQPDFMKLMSDGFFEYPNEILKGAISVREITNIKPLGEHHPWIEKQVALVKGLSKLFGDEISTFYNIFSPATFLKIILANSGKGVTIADYFHEDKEALKQVLDIISEDIKVLATRVITEGKADGIYLSVQNLQDKNITANDYLTIIAPSERNVLQGANSVSENNILHICGFEGARNDLSIYKEYDALVINWAVNVEGVSLLDGKKLFGNRAVIGGFDNTPNGILYLGDKEEIQSFTEQLLKEAGTKGVILGADCTVPSDINYEHLEWVREKARILTEKNLK